MYAYFTTVFKTVVKNVLDRQNLYFTLADCLQYENEDTFFKKTRTKLAATERHWRLPSSPIAEKNMCIFYVVVVAVVVMVVVAVDVAEDDAEDDDDDVDVDDDVDDEEEGRRRRSRKEENLTTPT